MGYLVATSGRVLLPERVEHQAAPALAGYLTPETTEHSAAVATLEELARAAGARAVRDGDWVLLATDRAGEPTWSDRAGTFYAALAPWVTEGEVRLTGADGASWSYRYASGTLTQDGTNGWDGSTSPPQLTPDELLAVSSPPEAEPPSTEPPLDEPLYGPPPEGGAATPPGEGTTLFGEPPAQQPSAGYEALFRDDQPRPASSGRSVGMALLLVGGIFLLVAIAYLASGMAGG